MYEHKGAKHHCFTCRGLAQCIAAAGVTRLAALLAWIKEHSWRAHYRIRNPLRTLFLLLCCTNAMAHSSTNATIRPTMLANLSACQRIQN